jgi:MYXO-CTERM domain-containing protein
VSVTNGCSMGSGGAGAPWLALGLMGLALGLVRRRRG